MGQQISILQRNINYTIEQNFAQNSILQRLIYYSIGQNIALITSKQELNYYSISQNTSIVSVEQKNNTYTVTQDLSPIIIKQEAFDQFSIQQNGAITVKQNSFLQLIIQGFSYMTSILPFSFTATSNNQTVFTLPVNPTSIVCLFIMGTGQNPLAGDYTISGNVITLGASAPKVLIGDQVFGAYQL